MQAPASFPRRLWQHLRLQPSVLIWKIKRVSALRHVGALMDLGRDTGGESSPYFPRLQAAAADLSRLDARDPRKGRAA